jgi:hypothetical protein
MIHFHAITNAYIASVEILSFFPTVIPLFLLFKSSATTRVTAGDSVTFEEDAFRATDGFHKIDECVAQIIATAKIKWSIEKVESTGETPLLNEIKHSYLTLTVWLI